jgi:AcrR family transcriptional regulator
MVQKEARPRGRPRSFDAEQVLERARAVFWDLGYAATSLDELSAATGLNRPSLYGAFGDKHALYLAALRRSRDEALAGIAHLLSQPGTLRDNLAQLYTRAIGAYRRGEKGQRGCFLIGTGVTQAVDDVEARAVMADFLTRADTLFVDRFSRAESEIAAGLTPQTAAPLASATLQSLAIRARAGTDEARLLEVADAAVSAICRPA